MRILPPTYFQQSDVVQLSKDLIGKFLMTDFGDGVAGGMIVETEAYRGPEDRASHAFGNRRTKRNEMMYAKGGTAYVYLCYGMHHLFNIVTNKADIPHAILVRAIAPSDGIERMAKRRNKSVGNKSFTNGPGTLTQALGITVAHNGVELEGAPIWVEDRGLEVKAQDIEVGPRIGIDYAGEDAKLPWRFRLRREHLKKEFEP